MRNLNNLIEDLSARARRCADAERTSVPKTFTFVPIYYRDLERFVDAYKKMRTKLEYLVYCDMECPGGKHWADCAKAQADALLAELDRKE